MRESIGPLLLDHVDEIEQDVSMALGCFDAPSYGISVSLRLNAGASKLLYHLVGSAEISLNVSEDGKADLLIRHRETGAITSIEAVVIGIWG